MLQLFIFILWVYTQNVFAYTCVYIRQPTILQQWMEKSITLYKQNVRIFLVHLQRAFLNGFAFLSREKLLAFGTCAVLILAMIKVVSVSMIVVYSILL